ncbi:hypothetical protein KSS87_014846 [Heliosperma pusillum]|nr:hypothetical protein KSS87_014846 [Heliosperma pusillum]
MAVCSQPSLVSYHSCCSNSCTSITNSNPSYYFPSSFSLSTLHGSCRTQLPRNQFLSFTKTHAKFDKFDAENDTSVQLQEELTQEELSQEQKVEDDDCLPNNLEGAVRQSSQASASFVTAGGMRAIVELLIPQLQFLDDEGAQAELWELSRVFLDTLIEETGCQLSDNGLLLLMQNVVHVAVLLTCSLSDRKPVEDEDEIVVMVVPDFQMVKYVQKISSLLSDEPVCIYLGFLSFPRPLIMWNPRLISEEVGVGVNVRQLKRFFLSTFSVVYSMRPLASGAVFRCYPGLWKVFYDDKDRRGRYLLAKELISRPDSEELEYIFGDVQEKSVEGPSFFAKAAGMFSSINRFMKAL